MNLRLLKDQACGHGCAATKPEEATKNKVPTLDVPHDAWDQALAWLVCDGTGKGV